jgi:hypothetical protein
MDTKIQIDEDEVISTAKEIFQAVIVHKIDDFDPDFHNLAAQSLEAATIFHQLAEEYRRKSKD